MTATLRLRAQLPDALSLWLDAQGGPAEAWRICPRAHWLLHLALAVDVDRALVVGAASALARAALEAHPTADRSAHRALRVSLAWLDGDASGSDAWAAGFCAREAAEHERDPALANAIRAAAFVAFACDEKADAGFYAHRGYAAQAAHAAELALADPAGAADSVRASIPDATFAAALTRASEPPAPMPGGEVEPTTDSFYA